jgi:hypothetical protein
LSWELYRNLAWLPAPPADFSTRCKKLPECVTGFGIETRALATLGRAIEGVLAKGGSLAPLTPFRLGVLGNGTLDLIVPVLVATAARHGIALECVRGGYDQFLQDALLPESEINQARPDAVLLALDYRKLSIQVTPCDQNAAEQMVNAAAGLLDTLRAAIQRNCGSADTRAAAGKLVRLSRPGTPRDGAQLGRCPEPAHRRHETNDRVSSKSAFQPPPKESANPRALQLYAYSGLRELDRQDAHRARTPELFLPSGVNCAKHRVGLRAKGLSAQREEPNALRSCCDLRLRGRYAHGVRSANG